MAYIHILYIDAAGQQSHHSLANPAEEMKWSDFDYPLNAGLPHAVINTVHRDNLTTLFPPVFTKESFKENSEEKPHSGLESEA